MNPASRTLVSFALAALAAAFCTGFSAGARAETAKDKDAKPSAAAPAPAKSAARHDGKSARASDAKATGHKAARRARGAHTSHAEGGPHKGEREGGKGARAARSSAAGRHAAKARPQPKVHAPPPKPCLHDPVTVQRGFGGESEDVQLTRCDGRPAPLAIERLSILVRPASAARPTLPATPVRLGAQKEWQPGVRLVDGGLVVRLQRIADKFKGKKLVFVSGYRPGSAGSFHQSARAVDLKIEGVTNEELVSYCRTLSDTGCGYYPKSSFVHVDVRAPRSGHIYWIDASGPGEDPRYVARWPVDEAAFDKFTIPRPDPAAPGDENNHKESLATPPAGDVKIDSTSP